jgi:hypothetical protein
MDDKTLVPTPLPKTGPSWKTLVVKILDRFFILALAALSIWWGVHVGVHESAPARLDTIEQSMKTSMQNVTDWAKTMDGRVTAIEKKEGVPPATLPGGGPPK